MSTPFSYPEPFLRAVNGARRGALAKSISNWHLIGYNEGYCSNTGYILLPCFHGIRLWIWPEPLVAPRVRRALGTRMVSTQKMAVFNSYSSRSGEIFFNEIYKSSKQINSQKTSLNRYQFMCRAKFGTNQLKSMKSMISKIYRYFWRFSTTGKAASKLHLGVSMQAVIHTKFAFSRLEQYGYCYN